MNKTPAEIIEAAIPSLVAISPRPKDATFEFLYLTDGRLAGFNDIETIKVTVSVDLSAVSLPEALPEPAEADLPDMEPSGQPEAASESQEAVLRKLEEVSAARKARKNK